MKKVYFFIILTILKNIQLHDINTGFNNFKNQISNLTQKTNQENKIKFVEYVEYVVKNLKLSNTYMTFFENTIKKKDLKITKKKDLLKLFHPDKCLATEEKEKVNILRDHFSMVFFPNEKMEIKNLEDYELIDLEKLLKVYQNLQIATLLTLTIAKAMVFRLCVTKFKRLETKILGVFLSSILLDSINAPLLANKEYI